jgi:hypothetical protein
MYGNLQFNELGFVVTITLFKVFYFNAESFLNYHYF